MRKRIIESVKDKNRLYQLVQLLRSLTILIITVMVAKMLPDRSKVAIIESISLGYYIFSYILIQGLTVHFLRERHHADAKDVASDYVQTLFFALLGAFAVFALIAVPLFDIPLPYLALAMLAGFLWTCSQIADAVQYSFGSSRSMLVSAVGFMMVSLLAVFAGLNWWRDPIEGYLLGLGLAGLFRLGWMLISVAEVRRFYSFDKTRIGETLREARVYLGQFALSGSRGFVDGFLAMRMAILPEHFVNFQYGNKELPLNQSFPNQFSNMIAGQAYSKEQEAELLARTKQGAKRLMRWLFPLSMLMLWFSDWLFTIVYSEAYVGATKYFDLYLLALIARVVFPQSLATAMGLKALLWKVAWTEWVLNIVLSILLVLAIGLPGLVVATLVAFAYEKTRMARALRKSHGIPLSAYLPMAEWMLWSSALLLLFLVKQLGFVAMVVDYL